VKANKASHIVLLLSFAQIGFGQNTSKAILGQILEQSTSVEGVNVVNSATQVSVISDSNGMFSIVAKEGDILVFSSVNLESLQRSITAEDLNSEKLLVKMTAIEIELKEVVVNENAQITTENLGIVSKGQKTYTPAERKLATAGDFKPVSLLGLLGGSMPLDPVFNKINGRTKKLKVLVEIEKKEMNIEKLGLLFEDAYFTEYLKIHAEYILGFKFYVVENHDITALLSEKNKSKLAPLMAELALKYNEIISSENK
jgi:hypothetical protein